MDIIAGNLGLNHTFKTSKEEKFGVLAGNFNNDMTTDNIHVIEDGETKYPFFGKGRLGRALGFIDEQYETYKSFSEASVSDIFDTNTLEKVLHYQVDTFASLLLQNQGDSTFISKQLPEKAQTSPILGIIPYDGDQDGKLDLILAGNIFETHPDISRADAGNGLWMRGNEEGEFVPVPSFQSGIEAPGNVKDIELVSTSDGKALLIANNKGPIQLFQIE